MDLSMLYYALEPKGATLSLFQYILSQLMYSIEAFGKNCLESYTFISETHQNFILSLVKKERTSLFHFGKME